MSWLTTPDWSNPLSAEVKISRRLSAPLIAQSLVFSILLSPNTKQKLPRILDIDNNQKPRYQSLFENMPEGIIS